MPLGLIFDIKKYAIHDGPGIRTTVFFKGCPLNCQWCHNPESRKQECENLEINSHGNGRKEHKKIGREYSVDEVLREVLKDRIFYEESGGGVTFSGGEPLLQPEFLSSIVKACKQHDLHIIVDTSGAVPFGNFEPLLGLVDEFYFDIKLIDSDLHMKYTGLPNNLILENLRKLTDNDQPVVIRIPMIPGITDTDDNLSGIRDLMLLNKKLNRASLLTYNKFGEDKRRRFGFDLPLGSLNIQTHERMTDKAGIFEKAGLEVKIGG